MPWKSARAGPVAWSRGRQAKARGRLAAAGARRRRAGIGRVPLPARRGRGLRRRDRPCPCRPARDRARHPGEGAARRSLCRRDRAHRRDVLLRRRGRPPGSREFDCRAPARRDIVPRDKTKGGPMPGIRAIAIALTLAASPLAANAAGLERLYVLDCGQGRAADQSRWSPGVNVGKPLELSDNCYLDPPRQGLAAVGHRHSRGGRRRCLTAVDGRRRHGVAAAEDAGFAARGDRREAGRHPATSPSRTRTATTSAMSTCSRTRRC